MTEKKYSPPENLVNPYIKNLDEYHEMYQSSIYNPQSFFGDQAIENLEWMKPFSRVHNGDFADAKWFEGGKINIYPLDQSADFDVSDDLDLIDDSEVILLKSHVKYHPN